MSPQESSSFPRKHSWTPWPITHVILRPSPRLHTHHARTLTKAQTEAPGDVGRGPAPQNLVSEEADPRGSPSGTVAGSPALSLPWASRVCWAGHTSALTGGCCLFRLFVSVDELKGEAAGRDRRVHFLVPPGNPHRAAPCLSRVTPRVPGAVGAGGECCV